MLDYIAENQQEVFQANFVSWTGDNSAHNIWDITYDEILESTKNVTRTIKEVLGKLEPKIEFYPSIGNHDVYLPDVQDFERSNSTAMVFQLSDIWRDEQWLSEEETNQLI